MTPEIDRLSTSDLALYVPLIVAMVELAKRTGMPARIAGLFAVILGLLAGFTDLGLSIDAVVPGLIVGLTAAGLYSATKALGGRRKAAPSPVDPPSTLRLPPQEPDHGHD